MGDFKTTAVKTSDDNVELYAELLEVELESGRISFTILFIVHATEIKQIIQVHSQVKQIS